MLIEAERAADAAYFVRLAGRNERLTRPRPGWTVEELIEDLARDPAVSVAAFDFPFGISLALLQSPGFASRVRAPSAFGCRSRWQEFVSDNLRIGPSGDLDFSALLGWWGTGHDRSAVLFPSLARFSHRAGAPDGFGGRRVLIEAYTSGAAIANRGPHPKKAPQDCLEWDISLSSASWSGAAARSMSIRRCFASAAVTRPAKTTTAWTVPLPRHRDRLSRGIRATAARRRRGDGRGDRGRRLHSDPVSGRATGRD